MIRDLMVKEVGAALRLLEKAVGELLKETIPHTPLPRPRTYRITPRHVWPGPGEGDAYRFLGHEVETKRGPQIYRVAFYEGAAQDICQACGWQPGKVLRAIRQIEAAARWCRARAEGRRRAAEEILRQQEGALRALEEHQVLRRLGGERE